MGDRRRGREGALRTLYLIDLNPELGVEQALRCSHTISAGSDEESPLVLAGDAAAFCEQLVRGTVARRDEIDALLQQYSHRWRVERMAVVDRSLLRLATFEVRFLGETPVGVVLNEAVELAKRYGAEGSAAFVNGILDRIAADEGTP